MQKQTNLYLDQDLVNMAHEAGINLSNLINNYLSDFFSMDSLESIEKEEEKINQKLNVLKKRKEELLKGDSKNTVVSLMDQMKEEQLEWGYSVYLRKLHVKKSKSYLYQESNTFSNPDSTVWIKNLKHRFDATRLNPYELLSYFQNRYKNENEG